MANNKYTVMSEEAIRYICGLIKNIVSLPSEIISNTNLSDNLTFSNIHIKDLVDQCLIDAKDYVDLIYGSLIKLTCEKTTVQPTLDNSQINVIYLYSADGNAPFQQYLKISETELIDMGSTTISLTDYLTATQIASAYVKQIDFETLTTSFNNLVTSVENKIDKDKIVTVLDDTVTDDEVASAKAVVDELGLKANASEVVKKTDIATVLDDTVTDEQVPSAKVVYDKISSIMSASPTSYSLDEQLTGGTWVDGKPIYRKTINFGALTNAVEKRVSHGITNIDTVVNYYGTTSSNSKATMLLPHVSNSDVYSIAISLDATSLIVVPGTDRTMYTKTYITVEYTKTTD